MKLQVQKSHNNTDDWVFMNLILTATKDILGSHSLYI